MSSLAQPVSPPVAPSLPSAPRVLASFRGVHKMFGNSVTAVADLDLDVHDGEFLSLLGPSGCGKSTVLRMLAGLSRPTQGTLEWKDGRPELGFVFQDPTLMPWATVFSNVWLPLRFRGVSKAEAQARVDEALDRVGLTGFANAYPRELSGGMKMRVSIARALVTRPALLLMDEPFAALDEITRTKLNDDLVALKCSLGATVVFVTHSVYESVALSTRILVMAARPGRVVAEIPVNSALPRVDEFRLCAFYADRCRETSQALHGAMESKPLQAIAKS